MLYRRHFLKQLLGTGLGFTVIPRLRYPRWIQAEDDVFVMSYFRTDAEALHLAYSLDAYNWQALNRNEPRLESTIGALSMRDPCIRPDQDGVFRLLWTDGWQSPNIGYSYSYDLIRWQEQTLIPMMVEVEHARNCWAPNSFTIMRPTNIASSGQPPFWIRMIGITASGRPSPTILKPLRRRSCILIPAIP